MTGNINRQLRDAAQEGDLKKVRALLAEGADVNCFSRNDGSTPLLLGLAEGHQKVWRHLLVAGARTDVQTQLGATPLHVAASAGDTEAIETLIGLGLPLESRDQFGCTPLIEAVGSESDEAVESLLKHGADPNATNNEGCTPLHHVYFQMEMAEGECDEECERLIALLKKYGADPNIKDKLGRIPGGTVEQKGSGKRCRATRANVAGTAADKPLSPADQQLGKMLENVGIQVGPTKKTNNAFFDELKCGIPSRIAEQVKGCEKSFATLGDDCRREECIEKAFCWKTHIHRCAGMIYWWHFGFRGKLKPQQILDKGIEMALTYFEVVADRLAKAHPKMHWTKEVAWFQPYSLALLMATLAGRTRERTRLSDYLHPNLAVETVAIPIEPALGDVLLCIAAPLQSKSMDIAPLKERLQKSRKQRPKLVLKALQALESGDRAKFASGLADCTANFAKTTADDDRPSTAIALEESILVALAYDRGWTDLSFDLPIAARLVTRRSLEMA